MQIYNYDHDGVFTYASTASIDPEESKVQGSPRFLIPADATPTPPPALEPNQAAVFVDGAWSVVADYRGQYWYSETGDPTLMVALGEKPPVGAPLEAPPGVEYNWANGAWSVDIAALKVLKVSSAKNEASRRERGDILVDGHPMRLEKHMHSLRTAMVLLNDTPPARPNPHGGRWRADDAFDMPLDDRAFKDLATFAGEYSLQIRQHAFTLEDAINALATVEAVQGVDPTDDAHWPVNSHSTGA